jgi:hypothetical protein
MEIKEFATRRLRSRSAGTGPPAVLPPQPSPLTPYPKISMNKTLTTLLHHHNTTCNWDGNILFSYR